MAGGSYRGPLPEHMMIGRGNFSGPQLGGQIILCGGVQSLASASEIIAIAWPVPVEMRVHAFTLYQRALAGGATSVTWRLYRNSAASLTGATLMLNSSIVATAVPDGRLITTDVNDAINPGGITLLRQHRDVPRDHFLMVTVAVDAGTAANLSAQVLGVARGYSQVNLMTGAAWPAEAYAD